MPDCTQDTHRFGTFQKIWWNFTKINCTEYQSKHQHLKINQKEIGVLSKSVFSPRISKVIRKQGVCTSWPFDFRFQIVKRRTTCFLFSNVKMKNGKQETTSLSVFWFVNRNRNTTQLTDIPFFLDPSQFPISMTGHTAPQAHTTKLNSRRTILAHSFSCQMSRKVNIKSKRCYLT